MNQIVDEQMKEVGGESRTSRMTIINGEKEDAVLPTTDRKPDII